MYTRFSKFICTFITVALGPLLYLFISFYVKTGYNLTRKQAGLIGIFCMLSYSLGVIVTLVQKNIISKK
ncbi:hypothetical protein [Neobacillus massiliamazoniensis]|uniref:Uncharacterized protein n=1 Tax=Neobacillus massiliamazoniensis TaxID=1499688 RepID=A0A0U1NYV4_9BACI|nr:hypothetical protein [Neobacillus massiliamazoniensis]CRK83210.1 hypothetical protein BN000_03170 [Neobacillus massiliamazoniensis]